MEEEIGGVCGLPLAIAADSELGRPAAAAADNWTLRRNSSPRRFEQCWRANAAAVCDWDNRGWSGPNGRGG